ncbi:hypothetical protein GOV05_03595 [Candidatus Woesearchaeota archaeon]|nr:hypothetical protein [Candidatus Woesearchaeota archaeon]
MKKPEADFLFESSFEVCNKVGGIYTVVTSKAAIINEAYDKNYFLIGPYFADQAQKELEQLSPPEFLKKPFEELATQGINCVYGKWQIKGEPQVILVDFKNRLGDADHVKEELWESFGVETLFSAYDYVEPMIWAWCVGILLQKIEGVMQGKKLVAHFHEWLAGITILYLKKNNSSIGTVFTTHATMLGRAIAGAGDALYSMMDTLDAYQEAKNRGVLDKYTTEKACAKATDIFTTVSEITGLEAEKILERKPEVLVLNGLDINKFPTFEETSLMHRKNRDITREFLTYYFYPYYYLDLQKSLNFFIFGRNEFKNKGIDVFVRALNKLNEELKKEKDSKTVFAFFFIPDAATSIRFSILESKNKFHEIKSSIKEHEKQITNNALKCILGHQDLSVENIFPLDFERELKHKAREFQIKEGNPPLSTHNLTNEYENQILNAFKANGLLNSEEDKVKVILYPIYVSNNDGLLNLTYNEAISAGHFGVFPSYYEPWGYTPLESAALGVPALTTDLAGYGRFMQKKAEQKKGGLYVLKRMNVSDDELVEDFSKTLLDFVSLKHQERVEQKIEAKELSVLADWSVLAENYITAQNKAIKK